jgi:hypothetical protein
MMDGRSTDSTSPTRSLGRGTSCWPLGVPAFLLHMIHPVFFIQTSDKVLLVFFSDAAAVAVEKCPPPGSNPHTVVLQYAEFFAFASTRA